MSDKKDRELGISMLRMLKVRDGYYENRDVYCSCNYHIGQPVLQSVWANDLIITDKIGTDDENKDKETHRFNRRRGFGSKK